ncbi:1,4-dihydroxy-2-naphthoate polyprenyltransferase [Corynebacterium sp. ES2794-CONJ1]|uniref:1,4-dihydroxy-2-naphthoate polyprenyltransferase n=1 Tax=unclassified Corynebacterium TaxID=2624378 RepID=UPI0021687F43|nr:MULTISPECIES: 1,4-dihydroxy-2-naphthoate polyprenyltransferase [unclassified Corynebacterium]MCS4489703.1 1,4-dihydroxy-2-naphthoate polyprenyltransferase [Corynebacterium sp. ES2775-CONJ]MCS4491288.1 1,4-dihydroxy-2-naphthoate polyprenyltransferase [Corynebacterium sp. ES2715-CONJ3]MCU9519011.1 1,4-dihydroxy-2-naphthoate polyprenyltransferase [Corynebacterium sp. ES2794-CONJ1]
MSSPTLQQWFRGARPNTWANAFAPVIAGSTAAAMAGSFNLGRALLAVIVSWALIVGVNYANDYSDGIKGTDDQRSGPMRLVGSALASPHLVKRAAFIAFGIAGIAGITLSLLSAWWLILIGVICILAAWFYTGGTHPYGYRGLGEVAVFIFFGLVAVLGTEFTQSGRITIVGIILAVSIGAMSASVNLINNLRDIPSDRLTGKITLAVRLGDSRTRVLYYILASTPVIGALLLSFIEPWALVSVGIVPLLWTASAPVRAHAMGKDLIPVLAGTGKAMILFSFLTALGLILPQCSS